MTLYSHKTLEKMGKKYSIRGDQISMFGLARAIARYELEHNVD